MLSLGTIFTVGLIPTAQHLSSRLEMGPGKIQLGQHLALQTQ